MDNLYIYQGSFMQLIAILFAAPLLVFAVLQIISYCALSVYRKKKYMVIISVPISALISLIIGYKVVYLAKYFPRSIVTTTDVWLGKLWVPVYPLAFIVTAIVTIVISYVVYHYAKQP
jgi:hypothetical protein